MEEEWRPVVGFEGVYEVSNHGRVRRGEREIFGASSHGYRNITLCVGGVKTVIGLHRLVAIAFIDNPEDLPIVRHLNDVRGDNQVGNLAWGSQSDNMYDAVKNGRNHEANKTTCKFGHPFDRIERGQRVCLTCRDISRQKSLEKYRNTVLDFDSPVHGTRHGYNSYRCRCGPCSGANAAHQAEMKKRKRENTYE